MYKVPVDQWLKESVLALPLHIKSTASVAPGAHFSSVNTSTTVNQSQVLLSSLLTALYRSGRGGGRKGGGARPGGGGSVPAGGRQGGVEGGGAGGQGSCRLGEGRARWGGGV